MKDPCKSIVKEANKKTGKLSLSKDYWSGALLYLQAAECYKANMNFEKAFDLAKKAASNLKKYASKYGYELVIADIEKALQLALSVAPDDEKDKIKWEIFQTMNMHAKQLELSGNQIQAAEIYKRSIEYAPSGEEAKRVLLHAINILETTAHQKALMGKDRLFERLVEKAEELRMLLPEEKPPTVSEVEEKEIEEEPLTSDEESITRIYVYELDEQLDKILSVFQEKILPSFSQISKIKVKEKDDGYVIDILAMGPRIQLKIEIEPPLVTVTSSGGSVEVLDTYEKQLIGKMETYLPKIKLIRKSEIE